MWLPLAAGAALGGAGPWLGRRLPPATAVRLLTAAMLVCALATGFVLAVAGFVVLARVPVVAALGHWSAAAVGSGAPVPVAAGCLAGLTVLALMAAAVRRAAATVRALLRAAAVCRRLGPAVARLVVVDDDLPEAYALPGIRGRVVVSTAMLRALPAAERRVLLAHETAHLTHRHHLYVVAAELAAAANPLLRPAARAVATAVEREADESAAGEVGDRPLAARALARAGLARAAARSPSVPAAALAGTGGELAERARALLAPPPRPRRTLAAAVALLVLATGGAAAVTGHASERQFERAQHSYAAAAAR